MHREIFELLEATPARRSLLEQHRSRPQRESPVGREQIEMMLL
jgi:hypothetical protein